ncbi:hypothetical protein SLS61_009823 [Didymella pomorum]
MPHVGRQWQGAIESLTDKKFDPDALKNFFAKPVPIPAYESQRRKIFEMDAPNPLAFTSSRALQSTSLNASQLAEKARLEQKIATLERNLREANDANSVARATAVANKAANDEVHNAERETQRAQMAEKIARNTLDDPHRQSKISGSANAEIQDMVKLQQEQEHSTMESGKLQPLRAVEPETSQDSPANESAAAAEDENQVHAKCQRERAQLITQFQELCNATNQQHTDAKAALDAARKECRDELVELKAELKEQVHQKETAQREVQSVRNDLRVLDVRYNELYDSFDREVEAQLEETSKTNKDLHEQLQKHRQANGRTQEFRHILEKFENDLNEAKKETEKYRLEVEVEKKIENHWKDEHKSILAKLRAEEKEREIIAIERDELKDQLEKTEVTTQEIAQRRHDLQMELQKECERFSREYEPVLRDTEEQLVEYQKDTEGLIALNEGLRNDVAAKDQRINSLERDTEILRGQNRELQSQNGLFKKHKNVPRSQPVDDLVQEPPLEFLSRPNNNRSLSIASHASLADELGLDSDHSYRSSIDEGFMKAHVVFDFSRIEYTIDDAPYKPDRPHLTVAVGDADATTSRIRQDSSQEESTVGLDTGAGSPHRLQLTFGMSQHTVADIAPSQPVSPALTLSPTTVEGASPIQPSLASLAVSNISSVDSGPVQTNVAPQGLTMHVFKQSVIQIDPESGRVHVTDPHTDRVKYVNIGRREVETLLGQAMPPHQHHDSASIELPPPYNPNWVVILPKPPIQQSTASNSQRRSPLELFPASSEVWPIGDELADERAVSVATQATCPEDDNSTLVSESPSSVVKMPGIISIPHVSGSESPKPFFVFLTLPLLAIYSKSLLPVLGALLAILPTSLQLYIAINKTVSTASKRGFNPTVHYILHAVMAFFCWHYWSQVQAWEQVNGVGFGEGYGGAFDHFGPYGNGHRLLSMLSHSWISADSPLPAKAVEVIASTAGAFEGLFGLGPTPSF